MSDTARAIASSPANVPTSRLMLCGLVLALSNFMVVLDLTVANVSVPHIAGNLGISMDQGTWIITSYAVSEAICVPLAGWLSQRFGAVRVFTVSMFGFGLFSLLCGLSVTLGMLVAARIGQGLCGAPLMPMSQTLLARIFPPEKRTMAMGVWAMTTLLGPAVGPILGGWISDSFSWHWIFLLNIPVAIFCTIAAAWLLRPYETPAQKVPVDRIGLALLVFWIGCLQIVLDIGRDHDWFGDWRIVVLAVCAAVGFMAFVIWEWTEEHPIVDLRIFRYPGFGFAILTLALCFGAYFASIIIIPQWLQTSMGYTATMAGVITALTAGAAIITSQISARLVGRVDVRIMISCSVGWMGCMALLRASWTTGADFGTLALPQILQGLALPFFMIPLTTLSINLVPIEKTASAAGIQSFLRTMAVALSTSLALTVWGNGQRTARTELAGALHPDETTATLASAGMGPEQIRQVISNMVDNEAMMLAVNHTFLITAVILFAAAGVVWLTPRIKTGALAQVDAH